MKFLFAALALSCSCSTFASTLTATFQGELTGSLFKVTFNDESPAAPGMSLYLNQPGQAVDWTVGDSLLTQYEKVVDRVHVEAVDGRWVALKWELLSSSVPVVLNIQGTAVHVLVDGGSGISTVLLLGDFDSLGIDAGKPGWSDLFYARAKDAVFAAIYQTGFVIYPSTARAISTDGPLTFEDLSRYWFDGFNEDQIAGPLSQQHPELNMYFTENMRLVSVASAVPEPTAPSLVMAGGALCVALRRRQRTRVASSAPLRTTQRIQTRRRTVSTSRTTPP
ncbi:MAG: PEP-CTERM sorting domain-containing protein [Aquabacterium sp.]